MSTFKRGRQPKTSGNVLSQVVAQSSKPQTKSKMKMTFMPEEVISNTQIQSKQNNNLSHSSRSSSSSQSDNEYYNGEVITVCTSITEPEPEPEPQDLITSNTAPYTSSSTNLFEENFDEIIASIKQSRTRHSDSKLKPVDAIKEKNEIESDETRTETPTNETKKKVIKTFLKQQSISPIDIINQHDDEVKSMTNTIEISNFYDYTESCMRMIVEIADAKYTSPAKVTFNFDNSGEVKKKLAVFDLDETLVHCLVKDYEKSKNIIEVTLPSKSIAKIGVNIRPHWQEAIKRISKKYHIVIYTASHKSYADAVLDFLDPDNKFFNFRLYRNNCIMINNDNKILYVKDCSIFKDYDLKDVVLVDNSVLSFAYHLDNGIPIVPYYDAKQDFELLFCACYLEHIYSYEDLRKPNRELLKLDNLLNQAIADIEEEKERKRLKKLKAQTPCMKSRGMKIENGQCVLPYNNTKHLDVVTTNKPTFSTLCSDFKKDCKKLRNQFKNE